MIKTHASPTVCRQGTLFISLPTVKQNLKAAQVPEDLCDKLVTIGQRSKTQAKQSACVLTALAVRNQDMVRAVTSNKALFVQVVDSWYDEVMSARKPLGKKLPDAFWTVVESSAARTLLDSFDMTIS